AVDNSLELCAISSLHRDDELYDGPVWPATSWVERYSQRRGWMQRQVPLRQLLDQENYELLTRASAWVFVCVPATVQSYGSTYLTAAMDKRVMTKVQSHQRTETDLIGPVELPTEAYYGVNTVRAAENFQLSSTRLEQFPELIAALAIIKQAAAAANRDVGALDADIANAIIAAAQEV